MIKLIRLVILFLICFNLSADVKNFRISENFSECNHGTLNQASIVTEYADFAYNEVAKQLTIDVKFSESGGTLANGFHFGVNSEVTPSNNALSLSSNAYKLAYFYVDASKINFNSTPNAIPRLNAFIFNREHQAVASCNNSPGSWDTNAIADQLTEPILPGTSKPGSNPNWVVSAAVSQINEGGVLKRIFTIIIDAEQIQNFTVNPTGAYLQNTDIPCGNDPNTGGFGYQCPSRNLTTRLLDFTNDTTEVISMDFVPSVISSSTYSAGGQLTNFALSGCAFCRLANQTTNTSPICSGVTGSVEVRAEEPIQINFTFSDPDAGDDHVVTYVGAPAGSGLSPLNNATINAGDSKSAFFSWTPAEANVDQNITINANFAQDYGNQDYATCSHTFTVLPSVAPQCEVNNLSNNLNEIKSRHAELVELLQKADKQVSRFAKRAGVKVPRSRSAKIVNLDAAALDYINNVPAAFNVCTENFDECQQDDYFDDYVRYNLELKKLYCDGKEITSCNFIDNVGKKLFNKFKRVFAKFLINKRGLDRKAANRKARKVRDKRFNTPALPLLVNNHNEVLALIDDLGTIHFTCE